jgi:hypothetical protein
MTHSVALASPLFIPISAGCWWLKFGYRCTAGRPGSVPEALAVASCVLKRVAKAFERVSLPVRLQLQ